VASTAAHKRCRFPVAPATLVALLCVFSFPHRATAASDANPGGVAPGARAGATHSASAHPSAAAPQARSVSITDAHCVPASNCSANPHQVSTHGRLRLGGPGLKSGMLVAFPRTPGAPLSRRSLQAHLHHSTLGLVVSVPASAHSGHISVLLAHGRHTNVFGPIYVVRHALHPPVAPKPPAPAPASGGAVSATAFDGAGMWIWYLSQSDGGNLAAIVAQAHAAGVSTLYVKSSDGSSNYWSQFSAALVQQLHENGLRVCAWQYVYGTNPAGEANLGAQAAAAGADCLVIDAESQYEGHYAAAQTYIADLRAKVGPSYPLGLASFPYVSYHPSFPYSVFLGPNGAQYNAPQMYWKDIGTSVDTVYANTYIANRIYGRPLFPLGQTYGGVSSSDLLRFREEAVDYGATGLSFWDWQETSSSGWGALTAALTPLSSVIPNTSYPALGAASKGDQVLWMQEHLASAIPAQEITGYFGAQTTANLSAFQTAHGIPASGATNPATWQALLALPPVAVDWTGGGPTG
jgi:peptidoglycan hydrolase-like protein with peptidoglycan-binding domain